MTSNLPSEWPGNRRAVPTFPTDAHVEHLRDWIGQGDYWVRRTEWATWLDTGVSRHFPVTSLTQDQCVAALAWLRQQQHALHRAIEGGVLAPVGWIDKLPLHLAIESHAEVAAPPIPSWATPPGAW